MKPKSVHLLFERREEQWNNKRNNNSNLQQMALQILSVQTVAVIISKIKKRSFLPLTLYKMPVGFLDRTLILKLLYAIRIIAKRNDYLLILLIITTGFAPPRPIAQPVGAYCNYIFLSCHSSSLF